MCSGLAVALFWLGSLVRMEKCLGNVWYKRNFFIACFWHVMLKLTEAQAYLLLSDKWDRERERKEGGRGRFCCCPSNKIVYLRDWWAQSWHTEIVVVWPSHSVQTWLQPVPVLNQQFLVPGRVATGMPVFKSLVWLWLGPKWKVQWEKWGSSSSSSAFLKWGSNPGLLQFLRQMCNEAGEREEREHRKRKREKEWKRHFL